MVSLLFLWLVLHIVSCQHSLHLVKTPLQDSKLCNNGDYWSPQLHYKPTKCFNSRYDKDISCDPRTISQHDCSQVEVKIAIVNTDILTTLSLTVDGDTSIRKITISDFKIDKKVGPFIDSFLQPRPAWSVMVEPYSSSDNKRIVFERYNQQWDPYLQLITDLQYPSKEDCSRSFMVVQRQECVHPGYSDVRRHYFSEIKNFTHILGVFIPAKDSSTNHTGFISASDCPAVTVNKWQCAFLLPTNCTLPSDVYHHKETYPSIYNRADASGQLQVFPLNTLETHLKTYDSSTVRYREINKKVKSLKLPPFAYIAPYSNETNMFQFHGVDADHSAEFIFMNFLFRKTAFYRRKIAETLAAFRAKYSLGDTVRTLNRRFVAAHIRRGDRTLKGIDMTELCYNATKPRVNGRVNLCLNVKKQLGPCPADTHVFGCDEPGDIPVGAVTLASIVRQADILVGPSIRNMIVFSDDLEWLNLEIEKLKKTRPDWRVLTLDAPANEIPKKKGSKGFDSRKDGTASGVLFQATIELAQQCEALIGHFTSGVPLTLAGAMCHHHAGLEGICPPVYDMKLGL